MLLPREQFPSLATEGVKGWNKMTRSSSAGKFSFNRELHLVVKSASLTALKHEVLNPPRQNSTGTSQPSWWLPTCCSTDTTSNWGKQNGDTSALLLNIWFWQFLASRLQAPHKFWKKWQQKVKAINTVTALLAEWLCHSKQWLLFITMKTSRLVWGECLGSNAGSQFNKEIRRERKTVCGPNVSHNSHGMRERKKKHYPCCIPENTKLSLGN